MELLGARKRLSTTSNSILLRRPGKYISRRGANRLQNHLNQQSHLLRIAVLLFHYKELLSHLVHDAGCGWLVSEWRRHCQALATSNLAIGCLPNAMKHWTTLSLPSLVPST